MEKAQLIYQGKTFELPVIEGTENEKGIDISKLRQETGLITLDVGYQNTGPVLPQLLLSTGTVVF